LAALRKAILLVLVAVAVALIVAGAAWETTAASPSVEVVVELPRAPLAAEATPATGRLDLTSGANRATLALIARDQTALIARIRSSIPSARIVWRYQVVLNGLAVVLPADRIDQLERIVGAERVTRSVSYHRRLDGTSDPIGAQALWGAGFGATGQGIRIAILDDGLDPSHPFFSPKGFTAPAGFPRGVAAYTNAKVIVARAFPAGTPSWKYAATPYDPVNSDHGMHVAGIAAGDRDTIARIDGEQHVLSGIAPDAYIGNYKVLTTPTPSFGLDGNAPEIAAGIEAAVRDGMDVINLSIGEPEIAPQRDLVVKALAAAARVGVVPVVAAGNELDSDGEGSIDSPGNTPEAISVAAATTDGVIAGFSSAGPTPVSLQLKPDVTAPGVDILSSYPARERSWTSLSGTSMATPQVAGAVALLRQRHPAWTVEQLKSALALTGRPVSATTAGQGELPPTREGGGMIDLRRADDPGFFARPTNLSFGYVRPGASRLRTIDLSDAGGGAGVWRLSTQLLRATPGAHLVVPPTVSVPGRLTVALTADAVAASGDLSGFVVLTSGANVRRIALWGRVAIPALSGEPRTLIAASGVYQGDTRGGASLVSIYRYPDVGSGLGIPTVLSGPEQVFRVRIRGRVANFGAVIVARGNGVEIAPRLVAAGDENRLTGMAGLPVDLNPYRTQYGTATGAVGVVRPLPGLYDIVFDTTSPAKAGPFTFRTWLNDVTPPAVRLLSTSLAAGPGARLEVSIVDRGSGVDPSSLAITVDGRHVDALFDASGSRVAIDAGALARGRHRLSVTVADYQETRNMEDVPGVLPNTANLTTAFTLR
jgi:subtilisin family serine protease